jgi:hypothetical protein
MEQWNNVNPPPETKVSHKETYGRYPLLLFIINRENERYPCPTILIHFTDCSGFVYSINISSYPRFCIFVIFVNNLHPENNKDLHTCVATF